MICFLAQDQSYFPPLITRAYLIGLVFIKECVEVVLSDESVIPEAD